MVLLITGASHTGKTLPAQRMLERYRYPSLCLAQGNGEYVTNGQMNDKRFLKVIGR